MRMTGNDDGSDDVPRHDGSFFSVKIGSNSA